MGPTGSRQSSSPEGALAGKGAPGRARSFLGFLEPRGASFSNLCPLGSLLGKI